MAQLTTLTPKLASSLSRQQARQSPAILPPCCQLRPETGQVMPGRCAGFPQLRRNDPHIHHLPYTHLPATQHSLSGAMRWMYITQPGHSSPHADLMPGKAQPKIQTSLMAGLCAGSPSLS